MSTTGSAFANHVDDLAAGVRLGLDEVKRIWAAFIELNMIALDRLVGWAE